MTSLSLFYPYWGFPVGSDGKESACSAGDPSLMPPSGRSPGEGNGPCCAGVSMDEGRQKTRQEANDKIEEGLLTSEKAKSGSEQS